MLGVISVSLSIQNLGATSIPSIAKLAPDLALTLPSESTLHTEIEFRAFWSEMILTFFFVSVILSAKYLNGANDLFLNALCIGLTLFCVICVGGSVSGGCYNPAVGLV